MKILSIDQAPIMEFQFLNAGRRPGEFFVDQLPIHTAIVDKLPQDCDAVIVAADLQGRELFPKLQLNSSPAGLRLVGEVLPEFLVNELLYGLSIEPSKVGVFLAGDFYTVPALDKRGGTGDVSAVWREFGEYFQWVVGVAGNHDTFGGPRQSRPRFSGNLNYLDGASLDIGGIKIAGIGGVIGNPSRLHRRTEDDFGCFGNCS